MADDEKVEGAAAEPLMEKSKPVLIEDVEAGNAKYKDEVDQVEVKVPPKFIGLNKAELEFYRDDPTWVRIRWILFILFWLAWISMFVAAIIIVATSPSCPEKVRPHWWQAKLAYQIWTPSFKDSNGDGRGDINGIKNEIDNLQRINIQSVWPIPLLDSTSGSGYDVKSYRNVDSKYGTNEDLDALIETLHDNDMYFIMDLPLAATSKEHEWFEKFLKKDEGFANRYVSAEVDTSKSPEYWTSHAGSGEKYLNVKGTDWPVLNFAHENNDEFEGLMTDMLDIVQYWLDKGVDGFYLGYVDYMVRSTDGATPHWEQIYPVVKRITDKIVEYKNATEQHDRQYLVFTSVDDVKGNEKVDLVTKGQVNYVINKEIVNHNWTECEHNIHCLHRELQKVLDMHDKENKTWPMWEIGNPYESRVGTRFGSRAKAELLNMLLLMLPGSINMYYGDELPMLDVPGEEKGQRAVMQWSDDKFAGFSDGEKLAEGLFVSDDYGQINFEKQLSGVTALKAFRRMTDLRGKDETLMMGDFKLGPEKQKYLSVTRLPKGGVAGKGFVSAMNFGNETVSVDFTEEPLAAGGEGTVVTVTANVGKYTARSTVSDLSSIELGPEQGIIISYAFAPKEKEKSE